MNHALLNKLFGEQPGEIDFYNIHVSIDNGTAVINMPLVSHIADQDDPNTGEIIGYFIPIKVYYLLLKTKPIAVNDIIKLNEYEREYLSYVNMHIEYTNEAIVWLRLN